MAAEIPALKTSRDSATVSSSGSWFHSLSDAWQEAGSTVSLMPDRKLVPQSLWCLTGSWFHSLSDAWQEAGSTVSLMPDRKLVPQSLWCLTGSWFHSLSDAWQEEGFLVYFNSTVGALYLHWWPFVAAPNSWRCGEADTRAVQIGMQVAL